MTKLTENIYLKLDSAIRKENIGIMNEIDENIESYKNNFNRTIDVSVEKMEENIIDIKDRIEFLKNKYSDYLTNYELENTKTDWKKKIETIINTLDTYNLSEEIETRILEIIEQIIKLDNMNCESYFTEINDILDVIF